MSKNIKLDDGNKIIELFKQGKTYKMRIHHKKKISWNPFQKRKIEFELKQEQLEQLAGFLSKHTNNGYPSSLNNIDFGTFME
tara:strand:- start:38 stop:283 length:246 start_codon:yes stop_codon:yes gene_type:complete